MNNTITNNTVIQNQNNYYFPDKAQCTDIISHNKASTVSKVDKSVKEFGETPRTRSIYKSSIKRLHKIIDTKSEIILDQEKKIKELERKIALQTLELELQKVDIKDKNEQICDLKKQTAIFREKMKTIGGLGISIIKLSSQK